LPRPRENKMVKAWEGTRLLQDLYHGEDPVFADDCDGGRNGEGVDDWADKAFAGC
jgi:hypothetical protein